MKILLIDDEPAIIASLEPVLRAQRYGVDVAETAGAALRLAGDKPYDLVLLDLGLPDADGLDIISKLRELAEAPIIVLSARHQEAAKVRALDDGADDFVNKPFGVDELLARIRAAMRRNEISMPTTSFTSDDLAVDFAQHKVRLEGEEISLSPKEFMLLETLCRHAGQVVTQRKLLIAGWNDPNADGQYLRSYIGMLRQKLEADPSEPRMVVTEPGVGYRLAIEPRDIKR